MSLYYKPERKPDWNYGGPKWRLSRSKIALFLECQRCFYLDNKLGTARPPGFPFNLNSAVDALLKKEFDIHRDGKTPHPLMKAYGIDAVPYAHAEMDTWRENFKGVEIQHTPTGFTIAGAVDDVWVNPAGELIVVDYKSTSKDSKIEALDQDWHDGYKRQMEIYQWLLRQKGFKVSDTGYFVYANASKDKEAFDGKLEFDITLIAYTGKTDWVEPTLTKLKECLDSDQIPAASDDCDYCRYRQAAGKALYQASQKAPQKVPAIKKLAKKDAKEPTTAELF
ncbi:MAG TPA: PD-(D/E)XK nuclease family protein [Candidatus Paceibacterota bacterium]|nr:PD-(D/E)XK nuclease family protein [Candidatus Paceibacterota bacterium]